MSKLSKEQEEVIINAYMAGQANAGVDPSYSEALTYYNQSIKSKTDWSKVPLGSLFTNEELQDCIIQTNAMIKTSEPDADRLVGLNQHLLDLLTIQKKRAAMVRSCRHCEFCNHDCGQQTFEKAVIEHMISCLRSRSFDKLSLDAADQIEEMLQFTGCPCHHHRSKTDG